MANRNFGQFTQQVPGQITTGNYIVGYNSAGNDELRYTVEDLFHFGLNANSSSTNSVVFGSSNSVQSGDSQYNLIQGLNINFKGDGSFWGSQQGHCLGLGRNSIIQGGYSYFSSQNSFLTGNNCLFHVQNSTIGRGRTYNTNWTVAPGQTWNSLALGSGLSGLLYSSLVVGENNYLYNNQPLESEGGGWVPANPNIGNDSILCVGRDNAITQKYALVLGADNKVITRWSGWMASTVNVVIGTNNDNFGFINFIHGSYNTMLSSDYGNRFLGSYNTCRRLPFSLNATYDNFHSTQNTSIGDYNIFYASSKNITFGNSNSAIGGWAHPHNLIVGAGNINGWYRDVSPTGRSTRGWALSTTTGTGPNFTFGQNCATMGNYRFNGGINSYVTCDDPRFPDLGGFSFLYEGVINASNYYQCFGNALTALSTNGATLFGGSNIAIGTGNGSWKVSIIGNNNISDYSVGGAGGFTTSINGVSQVFGFYNRSVAGTTFGAYNSAFGPYTDSITGGANNINRSDSGIILGVNNEIKTQGSNSRSIILGDDNIVEASLTRCLALGTNNRAKASNAYAVGYTASAEGQYSLVVNRSSNWAYGKRSYQIALSAEGGTFIPGKLGIGIDTMSTAASATLHVNAVGNIIFANLPTSSAGLPTGALWNNSGTLSVA